MKISAYLISGFILIHGELLVHARMGESPRAPAGVLLRGVHCTGLARFHSDSARVLHQFIALREEVRFFANEASWPKPGYRADRVAGTLENQSKGTPLHPRLRDARDYGSGLNDSVGRRPLTLFLGGVLLLPFAASMFRVKARWRSVP